MKNTVTTSLAVLALVLGATSAGQARSLNELVSASQINSICADKSPNERVSARFTDASGRTIRGTITCDYTNTNRNGGDDSRWDNDEDDDRWDDDDDRWDDDDDDHDDDDDDDDRYDDHDDDRYDD